MEYKTAVLGAGSWGTALALVLAHNGGRVCLWGRNPDAMALIESERCNAVYLPKHFFPDNLHASSDIEYAMSGANIALIVIPSAAFTDTLPLIKPYADTLDAVVCATKGVDSKSGKLLHDVFHKHYPDTPYAVLSGPSFAHEVANKLPTAVALAAENLDTANRIQKHFHSHYFRVYTCDDIIGVEIGGAVKNVLGIAAGVCEGLGFAINSRAALITRGLAEMERLNKALGGKPETLMGLAGLGDLVLTCSDDQSRNRRFGLALGQGNSVAQAKENINQTIEGIDTARDVYELAKQHRIDMPICEQVYQVIHKGLAPRQALENLLLREAGQE